MTGTTADACWIGGAVLFVWLIYDVFITVLSLGGAGPRRVSLRTHILSIVSQLDRHAHKHLSYPILHFFHAPRRELSTSRAVLLLADTCFMLSHVMPPEKRPSQGLLHLLDGSIDSFVEHGSRQVDTNRPNDGDVDALRATALELNAEIESAQLEQALLAYRVRRSQLIAACRQDGWDMS